ncbi:hypothetical protein GUJ93_ZPchr0084g22254 [Zizania palustris]|uniref:Secreted protein n=1 Tax=Zizania palustris TaxID=103762 RepID=A0A8J5RMJ9_ZIZPA|nr:hypothetical protein GUJ93_ZPchr0084g22254 [Zizania palustris]
MARLHAGLLLFNMMVTAVLVVNSLTSIDIEIPSDAFLNAPATILVPKLGLPNAAFVGSPCCPRTLAKHARRCLRRFPLPAPCPSQARPLLPLPVPLAIAPGTPPAAVLPGLLFPLGHNEK